MRQAEHLTIELLAADPKLRDMHLASALRMLTYGMVNGATTMIENIVAAAALDPLPGMVMKVGDRYRIQHDGFVGTVIGFYTRLDGEEGVVMQQDGTKVVHVYQRKWLEPVPIIILHRYGRHEDH